MSLDSLATDSLCGGEVTPRPSFWQGPKDRSPLEPSPEIQKRLATAGGYNLYGEPNFRLVWGSSRLETIYSRRSGSYVEKPKYFNRLHRWVIEAWHPPYVSKADWSATTEEYVDGILVACLGPYPSRGTYEYLWHVATPHTQDCEVEVQVQDGDGGCGCGGGLFLQITPRMTEILLDMVRLSRATMAADRRNFFFEQQEKKEAEFDKIADDAINDAGSPFGGSYFVPQTGLLANHRPKDWLNKKG